MSSTDTSSAASTPPLPDRAFPRADPESARPGPRPRPAGREPRMATRRDGVGPHSGAVPLTGGHTTVLPYGTSSAARAPPSRAVRWRGWWTCVAWCANSDGLATPLC